MERFRIPALSILSLVALTAFAAGPLLHEVVPHSHEQGPIVWDHVHAALAHTEKKDISTQPQTITVSKEPVLASTESFLLETERMQPTKDALLLSKGITKYRRFG